MIVERTLASYPLSFLLVLGIGVLLLPATAFSGFVLPILDSLNVPLPLNSIWAVHSSFLSSLAVVTLLLEVVYKFLIDVRISWKSAFLGYGIGRDRIRAVDGLYAEGVKVDHFIIFHYCHSHSRHLPIFHPFLCISLELRQDRLKPGFVSRYIR